MCVIHFLRTRGIGFPARLAVLVWVAGLANSALGLEWSSETADDTGSVGTFTSLALDSNGYPHISYHDASHEDLKYAWEDGGGWHNAVLDTNSYRVGWYTSIALDSSGYPHISYYGAVDLRYAFMDGDGWHLETVQTDAYIGSSTSLALDQAGYPHIAYNWPTSHWGGDLKYAYKDATGWHRETVDTGGNLGKWASLKLDDDGCAHVSYCDYCLNSWYDYPDDLRYAYRGASGWSIEIADGGGCDGAYTSLDLDEQGFPHISYLEQFDMFNSVPNWLKYAYKDETGWHRVMVDHVTDASQGTSLSLDSRGMPRISYHDRLRDDLRFASLLETLWHLEKGDVTGAVGAHSSLVVDSEDFPRVSYYHAGDSALKYARGTGISLAVDVVGSDVILCWSPWSSATSFFCHGEENQAYWNPGVDNLVALMPSDAFTVSFPAGAGNPASEWSFVIVAADALGAELSRSNRAGEREFQWVLP